MGQETELKLLISQDRVPALRRHPLLAGAPFRREWLRNWYFDTPDLALLRARMGLRLRKRGRRWVQTLKTASSSAGGVARRGEWEMAHSRPVIDLALFGDTPLARLKGAGRLHEHLRNVFSTHFVRHAWQLAHAGARIELALDQGHINAGTRQVSLCEVELELLEGPEEALFSLARELGADLPLHLSWASKAERGYRLLEATPKDPPRFQPPNMRKAGSLPAAYGLMLQGCLGHILANRDLILASHDVEALHQLRVGLRRLRCALRLMHEDAFTEDLRWLAHTLNAARDWDVFLGGLWSKGFASRCAQMPRAEMETVESAMKQAQQAARASVRQALDSPRAANLLLAVQAYAESEHRKSAHMGAEAKDEVSAWAETELAAQHKRCRKHWQQIAYSTPEALHALRIQVKRLRYALDFLGDLRPRRAGHKWEAALSELQEVLGGIQDAATAQSLLHSLGASVSSSLRIFAEGYAAALVERGRAHAVRLADNLEHMRTMR